LTQRLQELLALDHEARRHTKSGSGRQADRDRSESRRVAAPRVLSRSSVVTPFISAASRHREPVILDSTRVAAAR
jgi:hypothetical protein